VRYWYDTEFFEQGPDGPVSWISIGIVAQDGRELYLENREFDWSPVPHDHFIMENVAPHLQGGVHQVTRVEAAELLKNFITRGGTDALNELWAYYAAYDHVVLAQIFGRMVDMPEGVPWYTMDVKQELHRLRHLLKVYSADLDAGWPVQVDTEHHALADARHTKAMWKYLDDYAYKRGI
jgi:hypothetical protein